MDEKYVYDTISVIPVAFETDLCKNDKIDNCASIIKIQFAGFDDMRNSKIETSI